MQTDLRITKTAAAEAGISPSYFRLLAAQCPAVTPLQARGSHECLWTPAQVEQVRLRVKRKV
jgi:hypothetical protein